MKNLILTLDRKNIFLSLGIFLLTLFVWIKIIYQTPLGEGFYYFERNQDFINSGEIVADLSQNDTFGKILFDILPPILGDNIQGYMVFELLSVALVNVALFYLVIHLTKNRWVGFITAIFFLASYVGSFEMIGTGNYQRFVQRVPNTIFLAVSLIFLHRFLNLKYIKDFLLSISFYSIATFLAHFSTFVTPFFVIYPVIWTFFKQRRKKNMLVSFLFGFCFVLINYLLIKNDPHTPHLGFLTFLQQTGIERISFHLLLQFASLNLPPFIVEKIASLQSPFDTTLIFLSLPYLVIFIMGAFFIKRRSPEIFILYLSSLLMLPILLFWNLYLGKVDPVYNIRGYNYYFLPSFYANQENFSAFLRGDRYYYVPMIFLSIIWSSILYYLFSFKKKLLKPVFRLIAFSIIGSYFIYNTYLIGERLDRIQPLSVDTKIYLNYIKSKSEHLHSNTTVVVTNLFMWPSQFVRVFYGNPNLNFIFYKPGWEKEIPEDKWPYAIIVDYDFKNKKIIEVKNEHQNESRH